VTRDLGPPDENGGAPTPENADHHHHQHRPLTRENRHSQFNRCGGYAGAWREGFGTGFRDGLRLAARRLPPETWNTLEALADEYDLVGSDG
jgi:hypothetical protein